MPNLFRHPTSRAYLHFSHKIKLVILSDSEGSILSIGMVYTRSWPREGQLLCCDKVTKPLVIRNASLPHMAFALQTGQNHGLLNLTSTSFAQRPKLRQGLLMPLPAAQGRHVLPVFRPKLIC